MSNILVTGATGTIGSELVRVLQQSGVSYKAGVRDLKKAEEKLGKTASLVTFDFADVSTFHHATENVDRVFLLGPPLNTSMDTLLYPFIDFLNSRNIKRVVYISAFGMESIADKMPFHRNVENKLRSENFDLTVLRPSFFAQNFRNYEFDNISKFKIVYAPAGDGKAAFVDIKDVAEVAAKVLTENGHIGKSYDLTGSETFSYAEIADVLSEIVGEKIAYPNPSPEQYAQTLKQAGAPDFIAPYMITVYSMIASGTVNKVTPTIEQLLNRKPGSLRNVLLNSFKLQSA